jgi:type II secretory pathway pseudopilin PulG
VKNTTGQRIPGSGSAGLSLVELLVVLAFITIVAAIAISAGSYAFDAGRLGRTVADLRAIANAVAQYKLDYATIPSGGLQPVSNIAPDLLKVARTVPTKDGWGNDLYYEDILVSGTSTYRLYSYGKEGVPDGVISGNWVDFYSDIVLEGGLFIQSKY